MNYATERTSAAESDDQHIHFTTNLQLIPTAN